MVKTSVPFIVSPASLNEALQKQEEFYKIENYQSRSMIENCQKSHQDHKFYWILFPISYQINVLYLMFHCSFRRR